MAGTKTIINAPKTTGILRTAAAARRRGPPAAKPNLPAEQPVSKRRTHSKASGETPAPLPTPPATAPAPTPAPVSKQAGIIAALRRPGGATLAELMQLTGWLSHSVRGVLSGALKRKLGLVIDSRVEPNRGRVYRIIDIAEVEPTAAASTSAPAKLRRSKRRTHSTAPAAAA